VSKDIRSKKFKQLEAVKEIFLYIKHLCSYFT